MNEGKVRERTYGWSDLHEVIAGIAGHPHLTWMAKMIAGTIPPPPFASTLDFTFETAEPGRVTFSMRAHEWVSNPAGVAHGGFAATLLDTVLTLAVMTQIPPDRVCTTLDLNVHYVRPLFPNGQRVVGEGVAVHVGTTVGSSEGKVRDDLGRIIAHGTATLAIVAPQRPRA